MRRLLFSTLLSVLLCGTSSHQTIAQDKIGNAQPQTREWTARYDQRFLERAPLLNKAVPDVSVFDEQGNTFSLSRTQGKYTVLVFGCLT